MVGSEHDCIGMCMAAKEHPRLTRRRKQACEGGIYECVLLLQSVWRAHGSNIMHSWLAATHACVAATCVDACDAMHAVRANRMGIHSLCSSAGAASY